MGCADPQVSAALAVDPVDDLFRRSAANLRFSPRPQLLLLLVLSLLYKYCSDSKAVD
jgi:hypothetical protein